MQTHSELMSIYPWGETKPRTQHDLQPARHGRRSPAARSCSPSRQPAGGRGAAPTTGAPRSAAALAPRRTRTGDGFRGPQGDVICPASGPNTPPQPDALRRHRLRQGQGRRADLQDQAPALRPHHRVVRRRRLRVRRRGRPRRARASCCATPARALRAKLARARGARAPHAARPAGRPAARSAASSGASRTSPTPSRRRATSSCARSTRGKQLPAPPKATMAKARFVGAGFPDYPWLFATDGEFTAFASRRARPVRADQGAHAGAQGGVDQAQRQLGQGRPRGRHRRLGLLRRQRRRGQHRRDRQVPERGRADLALDRRRRLPRRDVRLREVEPRVHLPRARHRQGRLARGPRQRRAARHGRGEARQHDRDDARPARPRGPREVQGRHRDREVGGRQGRRPRVALRERVVDGQRPAARRLARRPGQRSRSSSATGSASRRWRSRPCATGRPCRA